MDVERRMYKRYITQAKVLDIKAGKHIIVLNEREARDFDIMPGQRVAIKLRDEEHVVIVDVSKDLVRPGEIGIFRDLAEEYKIQNNDIIEIKYVPLPLSIETIRKKIDGGIMTRTEIFSVVEDLMENRLSEAEISAWVTAMHIRGLTDDETVALTEAMVASGETLNLEKHPIADKHCIGGVAGNRTTMILVPIIASAGIYIPKTSSRAITSPAGTADTMEVLAPVELSMEELREVVLKTYGAVVWGGGMNIAPADDKMIKIRRPLRLDPRGVLLASILGKKKAVGAEYVIVDIPVGKGAKIESMAEAKSLALDFQNIGRKLGMHVGVLITDGSEPIGRGIGPVLEARDVLLVLQGKGPKDLLRKGTLLAGKLLELMGKVSKGEGPVVARHFIESGKALAKMREIIEAQGGDPGIEPEELPVGEYKFEVKANRDGRIQHIDNKKISRIARAAGAPFDKGAGVYLHKTKGDKIKKGDIIFEIYAESEAKLSYAIEVAKEIKSIEMEKVVLEELF